MSVPNVTLETTADALRYFASISEAATALGVTQPAVSHWRAKGRIPTRRAYQMRDLLTGRPGFDAAAYTLLIEGEGGARRAA